MQGIFTQGCVRTWGSHGHSDGIHGRQGEYHCGIVCRFNLFRKTVTDLPHRRHDFNDEIDNAPPFKDREEWQNDLFHVWGDYAQDLRRVARGSVVEEDDGNSDNVNDAQVKPKKAKKFSLDIDDEGFPIIPDLDLDEAVTIDTVQDLIRVFLNMHYRKYAFAMTSAFRLTVPQIDTEVT